MKFNAGQTIVFKTKEELLREFGRPDETIVDHIRIPDHFCSNMLEFCGKKAIIKSISDENIYGSYRVKLVFEDDDLTRRGQQWHFNTCMIKTVYSIPSKFLKKFFDTSIESTLELQEIV